MHTKPTVEHYADIFPPTLTMLFPKIYLNVIILSTSWSSNCSFIQWFHHQHSAFIFSLPPPALQPMAFKQVLVAVSKTLYALHSPSTMHC